ncbi:hypothetical protein RIF29_26457 [Crotalaria pallida]|uniref:Uncharacterized protein n=1 Tax=Crotalaria pallida TaxID=3830 RepID=A0AAN9I1Q5_CROPI
MLQGMQEPLRILNSSKFYDIDKREIACRECLIRAQSDLALDPQNLVLQKLEREARQEFNKPWSLKIICFSNVLGAASSWIWCASGVAYGARTFVLTPGADGCAMHSRTAPEEEWCMR